MIRRKRRSSELTRRVSRRVLVLGLLVASVALAGFVTAARASSTITVDCATDAAALVSALANASPGDTLAIEGTCTGSLDIAKDITLAGTGAATLDGQGQAIRVITIRAGATVAISGLTITGGQGFAGVGIHNLGTLTLANSSVSGNVATLWGGGIYNRNGATLTLVDTAVTGNSAGENGGGIYNDGTLTLTDSSVSGNNGGLGGGGVLNSSFGALTLTRGLVKGNTAQYGGGLANNGALTVDDTSFESNTASYGGGLHLGGGGALIERTTIAGNSATADGGGVNHGGGVYSYWKSPVIRNATIYANSAGGSGGGLSNTGYIGSITLEYLTFAGNGAGVSGAAIANTGYSGQVTLASTIVASPGEGQNCAGPISDGGSNLDDGTSCGLTASGSLSSSDPLLDPAGLADNGGPTRTLALLPTSPAIDGVPQASNGCATSLTSDQRGVGRPQGPACDIGAFELVLDTTPPTVDLPQSVVTDATGPSGAAVTYAVSAVDAVDGLVPVTCSPESGSAFPIADTTVECSATDAAGNVATASFQVHVRGADGQVAELIALVDGYGLDKLGTSLHDKLATVQRFLAAGKPQQAEDNLEAFIAQVDAQRTKGLTSEQADALETAAQRILDVIVT
jgi:predicted outer membrane repeat protein